MKRQVIIRHCVTALLVFVLALSLSSAAQADLIIPRLPPGPPESLPGKRVIKLPEPQKNGGKGVFDVLANSGRTSEANFPSKKITSKDLSTILYTTAGNNEIGKGPDEGWKPYPKRTIYKIYVIDSNGVFFYDWYKHELREISRGNARVTTSQLWYRHPSLDRASHLLLFASNSAWMIAQFKAGTQIDKTDQLEANIRQYAREAVDDLTRRVYIAAEALGIATLVADSSDNPNLRNILKLSESDTLFYIMPLGKK